jgi:hypothetical protein
LRAPKVVSFDKPTLGDRARFYKNMQWRTFYLNLNRTAGQKALPHYSQYLCRWSDRQRRPISDVQIHFVDERTAPPGQPQKIKQTMVWAQRCQNS